MTQLDTGGVDLNAARIRALAEQFQPIHPLVIPQFQLLHFGIGLRAYLFGQVIQGFAANMSRAMSVPVDEEYVREVVKAAIVAADVACEELSKPREANPNPQPAQG